MTKSYVRFQQVIPNVPRKTKIWSVVNDLGQEIGEISWHNPWRAYCYFQKPEIVMSERCLEKIINFIHTTMVVKRS